jgi:modulator of FtsH protease
VSAAYDAGEWSDLFVATAGATAALAGLLFVAVSINVDRILSFKGLPERALETLLILLGALVVSVLCLAPVETGTLGWLLLVAGVVALVAVTRLERISRPARHDRSSRAAAGQLVLAGVGTVPYVVGAISLIAEAGGGLYWILAGVIGGVVSAVANAWVLLIEILR